MKSVSCLIFLIPFIMASTFYQAVFISPSKAEKKWEGSTKIKRRNR